ncbi:FAD-dependent oxidoreductase [Agrobacterium rhizogenes]|nr:FAD-dependent oxidoreductase [Rhizobium rhizogenes]OCJ22076.1 hypothetical protein A6U88_30620 [Agrobacterium sp. B131/95]OCJ24407.1 hypothetical protein A6U89_30720 [Agrobacterium sp. B133/95]NTI46276.1 FAD-dependent oxidoreductase [Rhizobium rhizogenes]NTI52959.1 FAD-dependent oxidoreductase [Rhizobium rhizogenes]NTI98332.1 FAD-dependent oxidoreductase [Rhizobium rhizogenes]
MQTIEADVVIIGGGGTGLPAALTTIEGGIKRVILVEKRRALGGNASMAGGFLFAAESKRQKEVNGEMDRDAVFKETMAFHHFDRIKPRLLRVFIDKSAETIEWLEDRGAAFKFGHVESMAVHILEGMKAPVGGFSRVIRLLGDKFQKEGGQLLLNTAAERIVCSEDGKIQKVIAKNKNAETVEISTNCVILGSGGFTGNRELLKRYFPDHYDDVYWTDSVPNMGEGIQMATDAGAGLDDRCTLVRETTYSFETKKSMPNRAGMEPRSIWVNNRGERFADESIYMDNMATNALVAQPGMLGFALFDNDLIDYMVKNPSPVLGPDPVSIRDIFELEAQTGEWCAVANTFDQLASWMGADREVLKATIEEYNGFCESGRDALFAKDKRHLFPLLKAPFYALKFRPLMVETVGPVQINEKMQVLDKLGSIVPGFFAGGAITGGWQGNDYHLFGSALGWAINSGRIAGENAIRFLQEK